MIQCRHENLGDISARNGITPCQRQGLLRHPNDVLSARTVQQHASSDHRIIHIARANLLLDTTTPDERIALPEIQAPCSEVLHHHATGSHIKKPSRKPDVSHGCQRLDDAVKLDRFDSRLPNWTATPASPRKNKMPGSPEGRYKPFRFL